MSLCNDLPFIRSTIHTLAVLCCKDVPLTVLIRNICMIAEVDVVFPVFILQGNNIRKTVNFSKIFQFTGKKVAIFASILIETRLMWCHKRVVKQDVKLFCKDTKSLQDCTFVSRVDLLVVIRYLYIILFIFLSSDLHSVFLIGFSDLKHIWQSPR